MGIEPRRDRALPFSEGSRAVVLERLSADWHYAYDYRAPRGIKLLRPALADRLASHLRGEARGEDVALDNELASHGLLDGRTVQREPESADTRRSFNVWLHVVNGCNFSCYYCYVPHLRAAISPDLVNQYVMPPDVAIATADRLIEHCRRNDLGHLHVKFAGGEPTLNLELIATLCTYLSNHAHEISVSFGMITNGASMSDELLDLIDRFHISVSISIDGFRETHDRIRYLHADGKRVGTFNLIERSIAALRGRKVRPYFLFTVTQKNAASLREFSHWAHSQELGFRLSLVRSGHRPSDEEVDCISNHLEDLYQSIGSTMPERLHFERDAKFAEWNLQKQRFIACGSCRNYVAIREDGRITSCQMSRAGETNVLAHSMDEALQSFAIDPTLSYLANPKSKTGACVRCTFFHVCTGGCPQHTIAVSGTPNEPSPWCDVYGRLVPTYVRSAAMHMLRQYLSLARPRYAGA